ncbi:ChaN family lipoprotein [Roseospirillum parvum]|uniref:Uncharacterized iron-regulated protein n=1 Tax=Roseospirillum parvum TaxID=83401 RepID=A0A1G7XKJ4_9PROT|nr:ChaN family lipoprotein [Roseospirillum parvum]SDG84758.1 Uncharacterized iron-regulated protein [Roseospirillum parvum]
MPAVLPRPALALILLMGWLMTSSMAPSAQANPFDGRLSGPWTDWQTELDADDPLVGTIWDPAAGHAISPEALVSRLLAADLALLGEVHDNPDHHRLQAWMLAQLVERGRHPGLAVEMIRPDQTLPDPLPESPDALAQALDWANTGWPEFALYRPLFATALEARLPLLPANLAAEQLRTTARQGVVAGLGEARAQNLGLTEPMPADLAAHLAEAVRRGHCGLMPEKAIPAMAQTQRARDAVMAEALIAAREHSPSRQGVLIAGTGHLRSDVAVPYHARRFRPDLATFSIGLLEVSPDKPTLEHYAERFNTPTLPFDVVWFTPRLDDTDHCAELRAHMKRKSTE